MRAVYYCRVSTDEESQLNALEKQVLEAEDIIRKQGWELVDGYVDEGISGTSTKNRKAYNRLVEDLSTDKFDVVVIKSQDRLMRNVRDWYVFIDVLESNKKKMYIYLDNKFFASEEDALVTGIKAILAAEHSRELSKKQLKAHKVRQEKGSSVILNSRTWGYTKKDKQVVVKEDEAEIIRYVYDLYIEGHGIRTICKILAEKGVKSRVGGFLPEITIRKMIRNPLYTGTVVMNRKTWSFKKKAYEWNPEGEWIYHRDLIPAIVTKEKWEEANKMMDIRSQPYISKDGQTQKRGRKKGNSILSGLLFCGSCGSPYWKRYLRPTKKGSNVSWSCSEFVRRGKKKETSGCNGIHIKEIDVMNVLKNVANDVFSAGKRERIVKYATSILEDVFGEVNNNNEIEKNQKEQEKLIRQKNLLMDYLLDGTLTKDDFVRKNTELEAKLEEIRKIESDLYRASDLYADAKERLSDIESALDEAVVDEAKLKKLIKHIIKIVIFPDYLEIYFDFFDKIKMQIEQTGQGRAKKTQLFVERSVRYAACAVHTRMGLFRGGVSCDNRVLEFVYVLLTLLTRFTVIGRRINLFAKGTFSE